MKNRIITNSLRTIKNLFPRFLTLLIISFLGTFVFLGLISTAPNMLYSLDKEFDNANVYDIKIVSTLGLTEDDLDVLEDIDGVKEIEGSYSKDVLITLGVEEYVVNIESLSKDINNVKVLEGRLPENEHEIVVEKNVLIQNDIELGDSISFNDSTFKNNELTIVGVVDNIIYFNNTDLGQNRGTTNIGAGTITYYSYVLPSLFDVDYYTYIYITLDDACEKITNTSEYLEIVKEVKDKIELIADSREEKRLQEVNDLLTEEIKNTFDPIYEELSNEKLSLDNRLNDLNNTKEQLKNLEKEIKELKNEYYSILDKYSLGEEEVENRILFLENELLILDASNSLYNEYLEELNELKYLLDLKDLIDYKEVFYNDELNKYNEAYEDYEDDLASYNQKKVTVDYQYRKANSMFDEIPKSTWLVMDRTDFLTYTEYIEDTGSISNLSTIFPLIFSAVACLISLVSMNRMVEDDRSEIGTLKSLGFSNKHIVVKYLMYSFSATLIGGILGSILGAILLPTVIFSIYGLLFTLPKIYLNFEWGYFILGVSVNFILVKICSISSI